MAQKRNQGTFSVSNYVSKGFLLLIRFITSLQKKVEREIDQISRTDELLQEVESRERI